MSASKTAVIGALLLGCSVVLAAEEEVPDPEFLEYLGLWEESDEDWLMFSDPLNADNNADNRDQQRNEPAPEGEESMEKPDES